MTDLRSVASAWRCPAHGRVDRPVFVGAFAYCPADGCPRKLTRTARAARHALPVALRAVECRACAGDIRRGDRYVAARHGAVCLACARVSRCPSVRRAAEGGAS